MSEQIEDKMLAYARNNNWAVNWNIEGFDMAQRALAREKARKENVVTEYILVPKRSGKTTEMIKRLKEDTTTVLVVANTRQMLNLEKAYPDLKGRIVSAALVQDPSYGVRRASGKKILIDEGQQVLEALLGNPVVVITDSPSA